MENLGDRVNDAEQYITGYVKNKFSFLSLPDPIILPKMDTGKKEFIGVLLTKTVPDELDSMELSYDIVIRLGQYRKTLLDDRNKIIEIFQNLELDTEEELEVTPQENIFNIERSAELNFQIDDDFYDAVFSVSILI